MKRYRILGCEFNAPAARWAATYKERFRGLGGYSPRLTPDTVRDEDILTCCSMLAMHHLGYKIPVDPGDWLDRGFDVEQKKGQEPIRGISSKISS